MKCKWVTTFVVMLVKNFVLDINIFVVNTNGRFSSELVKMTLTSRRHSIQFVWGKMLCKNFIFNIDFDLTTIIQIKENTNRTASVSHFLLRKLS